MDSLDRAKKLLELVVEQEGLQEGGSELDQLFDIQIDLLREYIGAIEAVQKAKEVIYVHLGPDNEGADDALGALLDTCAEFNKLFPEEKE